MDSINQLSLIGMSPDEPTPGEDQERRQRAIARRREAQKRYRQTEKGKANQLKNQKAYQSRKGEAYREKERIRARNIQRLKLYNITPEEFDAMLEQQHGVCALCGGLQIGRHWNVDHDHQTGEVRGILCNKCNTALGQFHDDPAKLQLAIDYLTRPRVSN